MVLQLSLFFSCLVLSGELFAQIDLINMSLMNKDSNVAYIGIENEIQIQGAGNKNYFLRGSAESKIEKVDQLRFLLSPKAPGIDTLYVVTGGRMVSSKVFRYEKCPDMVARLGGLQKNVASREEIIAQRGLIVYAGNYNTSRIILSFLLHVSGKEVETNLGINGNMMTSEAISVVRQLKKGDTITFDSIKASCASGRTITLHPFSITIK